MDNINDRKIQYLKNQTLVMSDISTPEGLLKHKNELKYEKSGGGAIQDIRHKILEHLKENKTYTLDELINMKTNAGISHKMYTTYLSYTYVFANQKSKIYLEDLGKDILKDLKLKDYQVGKISPFDGKRQDGATRAWIAIVPKDKNHKDAWQFFVEFESGSINCGSCSGKNIFDGEYSRNTEEVNNYEELIDRLSSLKDIIIKKNTELEADKSSPQKQYWIFAAGEGAKKWDEFYKDGVMALGWDNIDDLSNYKTEEKIRKKIQELNNDYVSDYKMRVKALYDIYEAVSIGDIIYVKKGRKDIIARGVVTSDYIYDKNRTGYEHCRLVDWTSTDVYANASDQDYPTKTLTNKTDNVQLCEKLEAFYSQSWFPENYSPKLTFGDWVNILNKSEIFDVNSLKLVKRLYDIGGQASCKQLAEKYGLTYSAYIGYAVGLGQRIHRETNCPLLEDNNDNAKWWTIPFVGRKAYKQEIGTYIWKLRDELKEALSQVDLSEIELYENGEYKMEQPKNQILYGPPGTGKTYKTVVKAMEIIGSKEVPMKDEEGHFRTNYLPDEYKKLKEEFDELKKQGRIEFITFHQSYSYEEFVEGIKPDIPEWGENMSRDIKYVGKDGIFKKMCSVSIQDKYNYFKRMYDEGNLGEFETKRGKNYIISKFDDKTFEISRIDGTPNSCTTEKFKNVILYEKDDLTSANLRKKAGVGNGLEMNLIEIRDYVRNLEVPAAEINKKILIIDEINRGNISKIFGELITLIEEDKRAGEDNAITVTLPYSGDKFSVPNNLYIIGTMNTADKSLALLDVALRRRFEFVPMYPQHELIDGKYKDHVAKREFLVAINEKILAEKKSPDYLIGHAYFMNDDSLTDILNKKIIPLLMEYYNGKQEKVKKLLDDVADDKYQTTEENQYLQVKPA